MCLKKRTKNAVALCAQMEWVMMIRPQVASTCKTQQDISLPASFDGKTNYQQILMQS
ncbi:MAG: hypothetical protein CM15mP80_07450 [Alphaproteobacteria bacterium]|nr:MAG: hypothetical protein CM15mP80_07450 [Alphaproteobacteria bacterium]